MKTNIISKGAFYINVLKVLFVLGTEGVRDHRVGFTVYLRGKFDTFKSHVLHNYYWLCHLLVLKLNL